MCTAVVGCDDFSFDAAIAEAARNDCRIVEGTQMHRAYGCTEIMERHRHRYEFSNDYRQLLVDRGLVISGTSPDGYIVETVEIPENDFYIGGQYHPGLRNVDRIRCLSGWFARHCAGRAESVFSIQLEKIDFCKIS